MYCGGQGKPCLSFNVGYSPKFFLSCHYPGDLRLPSV